MDNRDEDDVDYMPVVTGLVLAMGVAIVVNLVVVWLMVEWGFMLALGAGALAAAVTLGLGIRRVHAHAHSD